MLINKQDELSKIDRQRAAILEKSSQRPATLVRLKLERGLAELAKSRELYRQLEFLLFVFTGEIICRAKY